MSKGRFGEHGGQYVPETLMRAIDELEQAYNRYREDPAFQAELNGLLQEYAGAALPALRGQAYERGPGRGQDLLEAGGPKPYRFPQDQ